MGRRARIPSWISDPSLEKLQSSNPRDIFEWGEAQCYFPMGVLIQIHWSDSSVPIGWLFFGYCCETLAWIVEDRLNIAKRCRVIPIDMFPNISAFAVAALPAEKWTSLETHKYLDSASNRLNVSVLHAFPRIQISISGWSSKRLPLIWSKSAALQLCNSPICIFWFAELWRNDGYIWRIGVQKRGNSLSPHVGCTFT